MAFKLSNAVNFGPFRGSKFAEALHQANPRLPSAKRTKRSMLWKAVLRWNVPPCLGQTRQATNCGLARDGPMGTICLEDEHVEIIINHSFFGCELVHFRLAASRTTLGLVKGWYSS